MQWLGVDLGILTERKDDLLPNSSAQISGARREQLAGGTGRDGYDCKRKVSIIILVEEGRTSRLVKNAGYPAS
jgi:hypothetical protein